MPIYSLLFCLLLMLPGYGQTAYVSSDYPGTVWTRPSDHPDEGYRNTGLVTPTAVPIGLQDRLDIKVIQPIHFFQERTAEHTQVMSGMRISLSLHTSWKYPRIVALLTLLSLGGGAFYYRRLRSQQQQIDLASFNLDQAESNARVPKRLENYTIIREIGHGGMAQVLLAQDPQHQKWAIKRSLITDDKGRLEREYSILKRLQHPNIVTAQTMVTASPSTPGYIVMQYVAYPLLEERLRNGDLLTLQQARLLALSLLDTLAYAHRQGCLHRDLKPANIFLRPDYSCLIIDFGIAKSLEDEPLTKTWELLGTPLYAPPEQANSKYLEPNADIYAIGVIILEAITGRLPWTHTDPIQLFMAKQNPIDHKPLGCYLQLPTPWFAWLVKATHPYPSQRFGSAQEAFRAMEALQP